MNDLILDNVKFTLIIIIVAIFGINIIFYLANNGTTQQVLEQKNNENTENNNVKNESSIDKIANSLDLSVKYSNVVPTSKNMLLRPNQYNEMTQLTGKSRKSGYCFVGYDNNERNCMEIGRSQTCMSGEIFPTIDICINPKLRL